jgi:hypothetical protein
MGLGSCKVSGHEPDANMTVLKRGSDLTSEKQDKNAKNLVIIGGQIGEMSVGEIHYPGTCSLTEIPGLEFFPARSDNHVS